VIRAIFEQVIEARLLHLKAAQLHNHSFFDVSFYLLGRITIAISADFSELIRQRNKTMNSFWEAARIHTQLALLHVLVVKLANSSST
jgi:hypothetical protein